MFVVWLSSNWDKRSKLVSMLSQIIFNKIKIMRGVILQKIIIVTIINIKVKIEGPAMGFLLINMI